MLFKGSVLLKDKGSTLGPKALWCGEQEVQRARGSNGCGVLEERKTGTKANKDGRQSKVDQRGKREKIRQRGTQRLGQVAPVNL